MCTRIELGFRNLCDLNWRILWILKNK
ncbi:Protein CBG26443 [Caenorhabditis briggsae]|uniref:Protein CBG26443 n=1 Tax=Caenorhabditis briggsae TaxID=6238 RepID=B6IEY0_CAEBR|nr:Protein CBG26443 [Caenorhabditis briggsae]CAR98460.1 Protein CBG26443 [Caenorhabditis briggsae]